MKSNQPTTYYIENLTVDAWVFFILPYFLKDRGTALRQAQQIYYFNNSKLGLWLATLTLRFAKKQPKRADFSQAGTRDHDGNLVWMNAMKAVISLHGDIKKNSEFQEVVNNYGKGNSLNLFLGKWLMYSDLITTEVFSLSKFVFFVRCVERQENLDNAAGISNSNVFIFMQQRPWFTEIAEFVRSKGINIIQTGSFRLYCNVFFLKFNGLTGFVKEFCKRAAYYWMVLRYKFKKQLQSTSDKSGEIIENNGKRFRTLGPRIAVEHYGQLNLDSPEMFSDLFFLQKGSLSARDILIYFGLPVTPVTDKDWNDISKRGMSAVAIHPLATTTPHVPLFNHKREKIMMGPLECKAKEKGALFSHIWLEQYVADYYRRRDYWIDFFTQHNVKMHVTWFKYSPDHCAKVDALKNTGGVAVLYQRSYDYFMAPWAFTAADVVFGFSKEGAHVRQDKDSIIPYYVVTGYLGDYRFGLLQKRANVVKEKMRSLGARKIMAYFDENAKDQGRWNLGYNVMLEHYSYLLNAVLENPWFGVILKPKIPSDLRAKLAPVSDLLHLAEKTGRCFIFEDGIWQGSFFPPAVASLGADVAVHGHLFAATAGIESALAGTPTLILDGEGTPDCPLYDLLGEGRVIFRDINHLWQACMDHWNSPGGIPGFADWSHALDEFDPFRDGRAAERMATYTKWLMEGFKAGLPREIVLADAAERYSKIWGRDKILSVNSSEMMRPILAKVS